MVDPFVQPRSAYQVTRASLLCAAVAAVLACAPPAAAQAQAQAPDAPAAKSAPKRTKAPAAGDAQQAPTSTKRDPATALATIEAAAKLLEAGKTDQAIASLSSAISGGNLPPTTMARALYLRGAAYRKQAKPAQAISDLTSALWLKGGLSDTDRADATQQRALAYSEAGLSDEGQTTSTATRKRSDGTVASLNPDTNTSAPSSSGGFFGKLFGGSTPATPPPAPPAPAPVTPFKPASGPAAPTATPSPQPARVAAAVVVPKAQAPGATAIGAFQSRVALVKTRAEADAVVTKLKSQYTAVLAEKSPTVGETAFGAMGTFFQVRIGPFPSATEATALCTRLKGSGLDCVAVNN
jgi:SPOR domain